MKTLYIMIGLPGSGKSTYAENICARNRTTLVSTDEIRRELWGSAADQQRGDEVFNEAYRRIEIALVAGDDVVFDATNLKGRNRRYLCRRFRPIAEEIKAIYIKASIETCIAADSLRARKVGAEVITRMAGTMTEPSLEEGFDSIEIKERA